MRNIKIGGKTFSNVDTLSAKNADNESEYIDFYDAAQNRLKYRVTGLESSTANESNVLSILTIFGNLNYAVINLTAEIQMEG